MEGINLPHGRLETWAALTAESVSQKKISKIAQYLYY